MRQYYYNDKGYMAVGAPLQASWICVNKPDTDDVRFLIEDEKVPPILLEYLEDKDERPRVERNGDWLMKLNYIELLRDIGVHFSVNRMLTAECFKSRLERGLSFIEFNYMIMQSNMTMMKRVIITERWKVAWQYISEWLWKCHNR